MLSFLKIVTAIVLALSSIPALRATNLCGAQASVCTTVAQLQSCVQGSGYTCQISNAGALQVSSTINVTGTNILIEGQGAGSTLSVLQRSTSSLLTILSLGSSASGITIQSLVFDGNNNLWSWCTNKPSCNGSGDHNNLKTFLQASNSASYIDVNLGSVAGTVVQNCYFVNSPRTALKFAGNNVSVRSNTFGTSPSPVCTTSSNSTGICGGLDNGIFAGGGTGSNISNNYIDYYRGAGIILNTANGATVSNNSLTYNANGDVWGIDLDQATGGGGQIYVTHASNETISSNWIDGGYYINYGYAPPFPASFSCPNTTHAPCLVNYGIEVDGANNPVLTLTLSGNTIRNNGISAYWIGGNNTGITLSNESASYNKLYGLQVVTQNASGAPNVLIKGGSFTNNGGWAWYNPNFHIPTGYGLLVQDSTTHAACYQTNVTLTGNTTGSVCGTSGNPYSCNVASSYYTGTTCP